MNQSASNMPGGLRFIPTESDGMDRCLKFTFSDSIILISHDETELGALKLLLYALRASQALIVHHFPVRGAISYGEMYVDQANSVFLGKALTSAYELEQRQNWIGVAIDETLPQAFPSLLVGEPGAEVRKSLFPRYEVPMKSGPIQVLHTLYWRWNMTIASGTKSLFGDGGDWAHKTKIKATLEYALEMRKSGRAYPNANAPVPAEVWPFFLSDTPEGPPQHHGDEY
jgi:hypothetical protein